MNASHHSLRLLPTLRLNVFSISNILWTVLLSLKFSDSSKLLLERCIISQVKCTHNFLIFISTRGICSRQSGGTSLTVPRKHAMLRSTSDWNSVDARRISIMKKIVLLYIPNSKIEQWVSTYIIKFAHPSQLQLSLLPPPFPFAHT